jgi:hypothetical protein
MTDKEDSDKKFDSVFMRNNRIAINYTAVNFILLTSTLYFFVNSPILSVLPVCVGLILAYFSKNIVVRRPYPFHNFYPYWFFAYIVISIIFVTSNLIFSDGLSIKIYAAIGFIIHVFVYSYTLNVTDQMIEDE